MEKEEITFAYNTKNILKKKFINSQLINSSDKEIVIVEFDGVNIQATRNKKSGNNLTITFDGTVVAKMNSNEKIKMKFQGNSGDHQVEIRNGRGKNYFFNNFFIKDGISIVIDDIPVKNTLSDPFVLLKEGKVALWILFTILLIKLIVNLINFSNRSADQLSLVFFLYGTASLLLLLSALFFNRYPIASIYLGIIVGSIELVDFVTSMYILKNINGVSLFFGSLRIGTIFVLFRSLRTIKKYLLADYQIVLEKPNTRNNLVDLKVEVEKELIESNNESTQSIRNNDDEKNNKEFKPNIVAAISYAQLKYKKKVMGKFLLRTLLVLITISTAYFGYFFIMKNINHNKAESYYQDGLEERRNNRDGLAIEKFSKAVELDSEFGLAFRQRADCYLGIGKFEDAGSDYDKLFSLVSQNKIQADTLDYYQAALMYFRNDFTNSSYYSKAIDYTKKFIALVNNNKIFEIKKKSIIQMMTISMEYWGDYNGVISEMNNYILDYPEDSLPYSIRGNSKLLLEDYYGAISDGMISISLDSSNSKGYLLLAKAITYKNILISGKYNIKLYTTYYVPHYEYGIRLGETEKEKYAYTNVKDELKKADKYFSKAIILHCPDLASCYLNRGIVRIALLDNVNGCSDLSKAGELGIKTAYDYISGNCR